ncbi:histidine phosphatase family protein [Microbulbifer sp. A4B17]|uniref:SixA phosphatase family protein n=1 Tax=Microbulbifer sp. A4B17 TaxID=359370 RepID=UPI0013001735|nr:phosphoglycerate mutase family protein [Microbulbifer sp. A4B17]
MVSRFKRYIFCILFVLVGVPNSAFADSSESQAQVIYLVRHAEKERGPGVGRDPNLTEVGRQRARQLAYILGGVGIDTIYSTDYNRTRETAEPLSKELGLEVKIYDPRDLKAFANSLSQAGKRILVVGHSNTTPKLAELLGGKKGRPIREASEFDRLYILVRDDEGVTTLIQRYGPMKPLQDDNISTETL